MPEIKLPIDLALTTELENVNFGQEDINADGFFATGGNRPVGILLRDIQDQLSAGVPKNVSDWMRGNFDIWLIPHRVSIIRRAGLAETISIGLEVEYLNEDCTCSIVSLLPSFQFVVYGGGSVGAVFTGKFSPTGESIPGDPKTDQNKGKLRFGMLEFGLTGSMDLSFQYCSTVCTPKISATGIGSSRCEWRFDKDKEPLFGRDIETWAAVVLPAGQTSLNYRLRFYMITRTFIFPTRRQSEWSEIITCPLTANAK